MKVDEDKPTMRKVEKLVHRVEEKLDDIINRLTALEQAVDKHNILLEGKSYGGK